MASTTGTTEQSSARPRIEGDRESEILDAAVDLLLEVGYERFTMDAVSKAARASKATLYRRWESKPALVMDALLQAKGVPDPSVVDTGTLRGDLIATFCGHSHGESTGKATGILGSVLTGLNNDPEFAQRFRREFIAPKVESSRIIYQRAMARGEVRPDVDLDVIAPALAGVLLHRTFVLGLPPTDDVVARVVDHLIIPAATFGAPGSASHTTKEHA